VPRVRVLVTGGAGFIGSHLAGRLLADGHAVRVLDSLDQQVHGDETPTLPDGVELLRGDVRDPDAVAGALDGVDRVVHLAAAVGMAQSMYEIVRYTETNALGAAVVLEEALRVRDRLEKVVVASSNTIYGEGLYRCPAEGVDVAPGPRDTARLAAHDWEPACPGCGADLEPMPTPETKPLDPTTIYAIGKRDHEEMFLACGRAYGIPTTALRFFSVYGPGQSLSNPYTGVAAIFASRLLNAHAPVAFEDGRQSRDFVYVDDAVAAIVSALEPGRGDGNALNVGSGVPTTVLDVARTLSDVLGVALEPEIRNEFRAGDVRHCFADASAARAELGWTPATSFRDGIAQLAASLAETPPTDRFDEAADALASRGLTA
jgi:dTDP-L-rhamnose 4-epimerase